MKRITILAFLFCFCFQSYGQQNTLGSSNQGANTSFKNICHLKDPVELDIDIESPNSGLGQDVTVTVTVRSTIDLQNATLVLLSEGGIDLNSETNIPAVTADDPYVFTTNARLSALGDNAIRASLTGGQDSATNIKRNKYGFVESDRSFFSYGSRESVNRVKLEYMKEHNEISDEAFKNQLKELRTITVIPTVKKKGTKSQSASTNISGTIRWQDGEGGLHPLPAAEIEIYGASSSVDGLLTADMVVTTNDAGYYSVDLHQEDIEYVNVVVYTRNMERGFSIANPPGLFSSSDTYSCVTPIVIITSDTEDISFDISNTTDAEKAFSLHHAMVMCTDYIYMVNNNSYVEHVSVWFPFETGATYGTDNDGNPVIVMGEGIEYFWDILHHEYGHHVQQVFDFQDNPGFFSHSAGQHLSDLHGKSNGIWLAWVEGHATYFGLSLQQEMEAASLDIDLVGDLRFDYPPLSTSAESNIQSYHAHESLGEDDELAVLKILWDIYDSDSDNRDELSLEDDLVWDIITTSAPITLYEAWEAFISGKSAEEIQPYAKIFADFDVSPEPTAPANNLIVANTDSPPTFEWDANGGGGNCCPNNRFFITFYSSSWDVIHQSAPILSTSLPLTLEYTPSATDWATITAPENAPIVHWVVKGSNTMDFVDADADFLMTGPYHSPARSLQIISSSCPTVDTSYSGSEEHCVADGAYLLPTDFSSVILNPIYTVDSYTWSRGGYICDGGGVISGSTYTVNAPTTCEPITEILYLNVTADSGDEVLFSAGILELTVYPDPADLTVDDLITFEDGGCDGPSFIITPSCQMYVSVTPTTSIDDFPVSSGTSGTVHYGVNLDYSIFQEERNLTDIPIPDNDSINPGCSEVTIPNSDIITDVIVGLDVRHYTVGNLVITLESPAGTVITLGDRPGFPATATGCLRRRMTVTFDDEATATAMDFENTCYFSWPAIGGSYQPIEPLSTFAGEDAAGTWRLCVADIDGSANSSYSKNINTFKLTVGKRSPCPVTVFANTADYSCTEVATETVADATEIATIFPNPVDENIFINIKTGEYQNYTIEIYNTIGQNIYQNVLTPSVSMTGISSGIYFIQIKENNTNKVYYHKFIKN